MITLTLLFALSALELTDSSLIPDWRSRKARATLQENIRKSLRVRKAKNIDTFDALYMLRRQWMGSVAKVDDDVPVPMLHLIYSVLMSGPRSVPSYAKYMDLGGLMSKLLTGGQIDEVDDWGRTAAHYAVMNADVAMYNVLADKGANLTILDRWGLSPRILLADPWRQNRIESWMIMADRDGIKPAEEIASLDMGTADVQPPGWVEVTHLPWQKFMTPWFGAQDLDTVSHNISTAALHANYFAQSKPFKVQGSFQKCSDLHSSFAKDKLLTSKLMKRIVVPGAVPYAQDDQPTARAQKLSEFVGDHMLKATLEGDMSYANSSIPLYALMQLRRNPRGLKSWEGVAKAMQECMESTMPWINDLEMEQPLQWSLGAGSGGSGTPFVAHTSTIDVAVVGQKLWYLYPPYLGNYTSQPISLWQNRHEVEEFEDPVILQQNPGDLINVPANWAHSSMCLGDCISFNSLLPTSLGGFDVEPIVHSCDESDGRGCRTIVSSKPCEKDADRCRAPWASGNAPSYFSTVEV